MSGVNFARRSLIRMRIVLARSLSSIDRSESARHRPLGCRSGLFRSGSLSQLWSDWRLGVFTRTASHVGVFSRGARVPAATAAEGVTGRRANRARARVVLDLN